MSVFSYNYYKNLDRPITYISTPSKHIIGTILSHDLQTDFYANSIDKGSFKVYRYEDDESTPFYDYINIGMYVLLHGVGWFVISELEVVNDGINEYKEITIYSLEHELSGKYLTSFGSLGVETDEQGGLDMYCLYSLTDTDHSILHQVVKKNPDWWIKYVDPSITSEYRSFDVDSIDTYTFLTDNASSAFDCIFTFDSEDKSISAYTLDHLGKDTGITLSYRNFIRSISQKSSDSDIKTVLTVTGGNDARTNTPLDIMDVNISGSNQIYDFSYYMSMMSDTLRNALNKYNEKCSENESSYQQKITKLSNLYVELNNLKNHAPETDGSTDWSQYGLVELQSEEQKYWNLMSVNLNQNDSTQLEYYNKYTKIHQAIEAEIVVRKTQIENKESEIKVCLSEINSLVVKIDEFLGADLYNELSAYVKEDTLTDDSFIVTSIMTDAEILEMQKSLLEHARKELKKVCYPKVESEIDVVNFTVNYDYKVFTDSLEMFNIIHVRLEDYDLISDVRLLKLHVNWDDPSDFKATFSNRNSLDDSWSLIHEIQEQAQSTASKVDFASGAWRETSQSSKEFNDFMDSVFIAANKQIQNAENEEITIGESGIRLKHWLSNEKKYDPCQAWMVHNTLCFTTDNWNTVSLALGHIKIGNEYFYGLAADAILGRILLSEQLYVENESGTYSISKDGMLAKNGSYQVKINPDTPSDIFSISIDNSKLLYVDANNKKLVFQGKLIADEGTIANWNISKNALTSGNVGMSSDQTSGAIAFWAGNATAASAPFWVDNTGKLHSSNIEVTGGSLQVGTKFKVTSDGVLTATNGNFSGNITASAISGGTITIGDNFSVDKDGNMKASNGIFTGEVNSSTGKIGGWTITGNTLKGSSGSYIKGGEINMGDGFFIANDSYLGLGYFEVTYSNRGLFQSNDEVVGMSHGDLESGEWLLWAGWGMNTYNPDLPLFGVNTGQVHCGRDLYVERDLYIKGVKVDLSGGGGSGCTCDSYSCSGDACGGGDECGAAYTGGSSCSSDGGSSGSCTCDGYYDVPGCTVVTGCTTDS